MPELFWDASSYFAARRDPLRITALNVDQAQNISFVINGKLFRRTAAGAVTELSGGNYAPLDDNPVKNIVNGADSDYLLHTANGDLYRLAFGDLRTDFVRIGRLEGVIGRQGAEPVAVDLSFKRLVAYQRGGPAGYSPKEIGKLAQLVPLLGNRSTRQPTEKPVSATLDRDGLLFLIEEREGSVLRFANDNAVIRVARSTYDPANPPPAILHTENFTVDSLPYRAVAVASNSEGRLYLLDRACNLLVQTDGSNLRLAYKFQSTTECSGATLLFDSERNVIVALHAQGQLLIGSGSPFGGEWAFRTIYSAGGAILSASNLSSGEVFVLEGNPGAFSLMKRVNPTTQRVATIAFDPRAGLPASQISSAAVDPSGAIAAIGCCFGADAHKELTFYSFSGSAITGTGGRVFLNEASPDEQPETVYATSRGLIVRSSSNRLFTTDTRRLRPPESVAATRSGLAIGAVPPIVFTPGQKKEVQIPLTATATFVRFRSGLFCDGSYPRYARLGPAAGVAPAKLLFSLETDAVSLPRGVCTITILSDTDGETARASIVLTPDNLPSPGTPDPPKNDISIFDSPPPFTLDARQQEVQRTLYIRNLAPTPRLINILAPPTDGIVVQPQSVNVPGYSFGSFVFKFTPAKLNRQAYSILYLLSCPQCLNSELFQLNFQVSQNPASIDLSSEAALIDAVVAKARNQDLWPLSNVILTELPDDDLVIRTDFPSATAPWFTVKKGPATVFPDGRLNIRFDLLLNRSALPNTATSATVVFESGSAAAAARRFVTVFFIPESEGTRAQIIGAEAGQAVSLAKGQIGRLRIPFHNRSAAPLAYTAYAIRPEGTSTVVYSSEGTAANGVNSVALNIERSSEASTAADSLDIVVAFSNSEKLLYRLDVINGDLKPAAAAAKSGARAIGACPAKSLFITPREPALPFSVARNIGGRFVFELRDNCGQLLNASDGASLIFNVSPPNGSIATTSLGNGIWESFWRPERPADSVSIKVVAARAPNEFEVYAGQLTLSGAVTDTSVPSVRAFSLVDGASFIEKQLTAPGAVISLFGDNLAPQARGAAGDSPQLPRELEGLNVQINGRTVPLWYVSPTQLNIQVPSNLPPAEYRVFVNRDNFSSAPAAIAVGASSPGIFTVDQSGSGQGQVWYTNASGDTVLASPASPVIAGETITIFANGLGPTDPMLEEGTPAPASESGDVYSVRGEVQVLIAGRPAALRQASLAPGLIGVYRIQAVVPMETEPGSAIPLKIRANGADSQTVTFAVR